MLLTGTMEQPTRRDFIRSAAIAGSALQVGAAPAPGLAEMARLWERAPENPDYMPRTRWWWPGSAASPEGITAQLEQMRANGLGGVEIVHTWRFYTSGNHEFLSPSWAALIRHALREASRLDMKVALTFSPGWDFGGPWVEPEDRSKVLAPCFVDLEGPRDFDGPLPEFRDFGTPATGLFENLAPVEGQPRDQDLVLAAVAGRLEGERILGDSLADLGGALRGGALRWKVPPGRWRLVAFRLRYTGQMNSAQDSEPRSWVVDHLSAGAMRRYLAPVAQFFRKEFGPWLGGVIDSVFADSFEAVPLRDTILWSNSTLEEFRRRKGYSLARFLPALWWDIGERTSQIRYDVNEFLHQIALDFCFRPFLEVCSSLGLQGRMQPHYRFNEEIIQGAGMAHIPETEVTTARFETVADPRKATVAGARFYGRPLVSAEAYTFIHPQRYRTTPEELKIATDAFLRDGVTRFYNHGFIYTEEPSVVPLRDMPWASRISPWSPWWPYYKHLAAYVARASAMLRHGSFVGDVLLYSPQAQVWRTKAVFNVEQRVMKYGDVPKTLLANGYDYDPVNDDVLVRLARVRNGRIEIGDQSYRVLILPAIEWAPPATVKALRRLIAQGADVIALDRTPAPDLGRLLDYGFTPNNFSPQEQPYTRTPPLRAGQRRLLDYLRSRLEPDFRLPGDAQSDGPTFHHRRYPGGLDVYFVANLMPEPFRGEITFRVRDCAPELWNALDGSRALPASWSSKDGGTGVELDLPAWHSVFVVFLPGWKVPPVQKAAARIDEHVVDWPRLTPGAEEYSHVFDAPREFTAREASIDLGRVGCVAEVSLNGAALGCRWMSPYRFPIPRGVLKEKGNRLEVRVAGTLMERVQAMTSMPPLPAKLRARLGEPREPGPRQLAAWERDRNFKPLPLTGLAGPVKLVAARD
jgi:hypothetical protein